MPSMLEDTHLIISILKQDAKLVIFEGLQT